VFRSIRAHIKRDGFTAAYLDYCAGFEYPECYAAFGLLVAASAAINGRITINAGYKPETMPNLYVVLYGPSGARKSEALLDAAIHLMAEAVPETPILPMNATPEGLRHRLVADSRCSGVKNELRCENDKHHGAARGLILSEEFVSLIGGAEYQQHAARFLSKMWDTPRPFETFSTIAHGEEVIRNRYVVIGSCTTPKDFHSVNFDALEGGLLRRLLIVQSFEPTKESARPRIDYPRLRALQKVFDERLGHGAFSGDIGMSLSPAAAEANEKWYTTTLRRYRERAKGEKAGKFINSAQVHAFKIAAILELLEGGRPDIMQAESLRAAFGIVSDLLPGTFQAYEGMVPTALARLKTVVFESIAAQPGGVSDLDIDVQVGAEMGVEADSVARARKALLAEHKLVRGADGLLRLTGRVYSTSLEETEPAAAEPDAAAH
jgi:hypothetical protein